MRVVVLHAPMVIVSSTKREETEERAGVERDGSAVSWAETTSGVEEMETCHASPLLWRNTGPGS